MTDDDAITQIRNLEADRCRALVTNDIVALAALVSDDLIHINTSGAVEDKAQYLAGVEKRLTFLSVERGELTIRVYGDVAVVTGRLDQMVLIRAAGETRRFQALVTQVWRKFDGRWLICSFHACLENQPVR